jgi:XTP/dITP diphosphohydrolase
LRITLVKTSARVAPGVLTASVWDLLRSVPVFCGSADHPQRAALAEVGVPVEVVDVPVDVPVEVVDGEVGIGRGALGGAGSVFGGVGDVFGGARRVAVSGQPGTGGVPAVRVNEAFVTAMRARAEDAGVAEVAWLLEPAYAPPSTTADADHPGQGRPGPTDDAGGASTEMTDVEVCVLAGTRELPGSALLERGTAVMDRLRSPGGCPWDAEQTHASLAPYLLEEAYEAYQAIEDGNLAELREELGDVLLQVLFHARVAAEGADREPGAGGSGASSGASSGAEAVGGGGGAGGSDGEQVDGGSGGGSGWDVDAVAAGLVAKLVRRHPHVFGDVTVAGADEVVTNWQAIKDAEKKGRASVTDGIPVSLPALSLAPHTPDPVRPPRCPARCDS